MRKQIQKFLERLPKPVKKLLENKRLLKNIALFIGGVFILFTGVGLIWLASLKIPDFNSFEDRKIINSTKLYDRTGEILLYDIHQDVKRTNIPFEQMGTNIKEATVAIEDSEFYNHSGIRIKSIFRATIWAKITGKRVTGGSTITQQLIKNTLLTAETTLIKKVGRKIKEWMLAIKVDNAMSKEKILELYLNEIPYGGTLYGIQEASMTYFDKKPMDLTIAEAAYLASIPQSPTLLSPYGKNRERLDDRKNYVLSRMYELEYISKEEYEQAKNEVVEFVPRLIAGIKAPHFVFFIREYLEEKYGAEMVERGGLRVITTLDYTLQEKGEQFTKEGALENSKNWNGENAGLVAVDPKTGQILTMVGSRDYFDTEIDGNYNIATALRQPGSAFKPFIYATAFNKGFTENTVLFDLPTEFSGTCNASGSALPGYSQQSCYMPDNYDGEFRGPLKLRDALAQSINIPAVKLFYLAGLSDSLKISEDMGISTLGDVSRYGLTLVIGGGEVSLLDITSAYSVLANSGVRNPYTGVLRIEDPHGNVLEEFTPKPKEVLPKNTALLLSDILKDNNARTPTFGANSPLKVGNYEVAVKTGTTNSNRDAWTIGYTPSIAVGVWAGNNDNTPMKKGGSALAGPIWNKFMSEVLKNIPTEQFENPNKDVDPGLKPVLRGYWQGNETFVIDRISGKLATENTPPETRVEKVITNVHSILYWVDRNDILGPPPSNPASNPQFARWDAPIQSWWARNSYNYGFTSSYDRPTEYDDVHTPENQSMIQIVEPNSTIIYSPDQQIQIQIMNQKPVPLQKIDVFINDVYIGTSEYPFSLSFIPRDLENLRSSNEILVVSYDANFNRGEARMVFNVSN
ncbi:MAG: transglycosylase domain-containing protein [Candidatus Paceibacterota bacterium]